MDKVTLIVWFKGHPQIDIRSIAEGLWNNGQVPRIPTWNVVEGNLKLTFSNVPSLSQKAVEKDIRAAFPVELVDTIEVQ